MSHSDIALALKDAMSKQASRSNVDKAFLVEQLNLIEGCLAPLKTEIEYCTEHAHMSAVRSGAAFTGIIFLQFMASQYGTYIAFSWDIMEPIMCCATLSDAIAGYFFWLWAGKPWDISGLKEHFYQRRMRKLFRKHSIDFETYQMLCQTKQEILDQLAMK